MIDVKGALQLYAELRDRGADSVAWRQHLAGQLERLVGSQVTMLVELELAEQVPRIVSSVEYGWDAGFDRETWLEAQRTFAREPFSHIAFVRYSPSLLEAEVASADRGTLVSDAEWYSSDEYQQLHARGGLDALAYASCRLKHYENRRFLLILNRGIGSEAFQRKELDVVEALLAQVSESVGTSLASMDTPSPSQLPQRRRAVLELLLLGKSDKEIAQELEMAFETVRGHVKNLFLFFRVEGRSELLARWVAYGRSRGE